MKKIIEEAMNYSLPKFTLLGEMFQKPIALVLTTLSSVVATNVVDIKQAIVLLGIFFVGDFLTGLLASYLEWKKLKHKKDAYFLAEAKALALTNSKNVS